MNLIHYLQNLQQPYEGAFALTLHNVFLDTLGRILVAVLLPHVFLERNRWPLLSLSRFMLRIFVHALTAVFSSVIIAYSEIIQALFLNFFYYREIFYFATV